MIHIIAHIAKFKNIQITFHQKQDLAGKIIIWKATESKNAKRKSYKINI